MRDLFQVRLDLRALAALRIALGALVFIDVLLRCRDLNSFYSDAGALPRAVLLSIPHPTLFNLMLSVGTATGALIFFGLLGASSLAMMAGWNTRLCTIATWVLHIAVKHRNPLVLDAGDLELGLILWWAIFLPLGARYSWDAGRQPQWKDLPNPYSSVATTGYLLQISLMYLFAAVGKSDPVWWQNGLALYYVFNYDAFATPLGKALLSMPEVLQGLTRLSLILEFLIPVLLWVPWKREKFRAFACLLILALHLGIALTMNLGLMVFINILVTVGLWPGGLWAKLLGSFRLPQRAEGPPRPCPSYQLSKSLSVFLVVICLYVVHLNWSVVRATIVPYPIKLFGYLFRQQQDWTLFAPHPGTADGWLVAQGERLDGQTIDLLRKGQAVDLAKPNPVAAIYPNHRWHVWLTNLVDRNDPKVLEAFCQWLVGDWNTHHRGPSGVKSVTLIYISEPTPPPGGPLLTGRTTLYEYQAPEASYNKPNEVYLPLDFPPVEPANPEKK